MSGLIPSWADNICGVARADDQVREWPRIEVLFVGRSVKFGIDLLSGAVTDGERATCTIHAQEALLESIAQGLVTLQSAHNSGALQLSGDPTHLLRLAVLFDRIKQLE